MKGEQADLISKKMIKSALESMLFVWGDPLEVAAAAEVFGVDEKEIHSYFKELQNEYEEQERGIVIQEFGNKFQISTRPENREYIERLCSPIKEKRLSQSALETLAIIAYKQPVTKGEMESIRGVKCSSVLEGLTQKGLIEEVGRSDAIGRPILYGTTDLFLRYFGIVNLEELPQIDSEELSSEPEDNGIVQLSF